METTAEATVDSALPLLTRAGEPFDCTQVRDLAEPKAPEAPALAWSGKPDLRIYDGLITSRLAVAAETTSRFTKTGHGDALPTQLVLMEHEAEDRCKRRIIRLRRESSLPLSKTHDLGHRLVESGHSVLFDPACRLVQELLAARRDPDRPRRLRKLENFEFLLRGAEEPEALFTLYHLTPPRDVLGNNLKPIPL